VHSVLAFVWRFSVINRFWWHGERNKGLCPSGGGFSAGTIYRSVYRNRGGPPGGGAILGNFTPPSAAREDFLMAPPQPKVLSAKTMTNE
jgi:hypothetical protein